MVSIKRERGRERASEREVEKIEKERERERHWARKRELWGDGDDVKGA